ncbi:MAG: hypothetical protein V7776_00280 [Halopseudomonas aestusnigri]
MPLFRIDLLRTAFRGEVDFRFFGAVFFAPAFLGAPLLPALVILRLGSAFKALAPRVEGFFFEVFLGVFLSVAIIQLLNYSLKSGYRQEHVKKVTILYYTIKKAGLHCSPTFYISWFA